MTITPELLISLLASLGTIGAGVGAYAAIRYDLGRLHERSTHAAEIADEAHRRIDQLYQDR